MTKRIVTLIILLLFLLFSPVHAQQNGPVIASGSTLMTVTLVLDDSTVIEIPIDLEVTEISDTLVITASVSDSLNLTATADVRSPLHIAPLSGIAAADDIPDSFVVKRHARLRAGPGGDYAIVGTVAAGEAVEVEGKDPSGDWLLLDGGDWIAAYLVDGDATGATIVMTFPTATMPSTPEPTDTPQPTPTPRVIRMVANSLVVLYSSPGKDFPEVGFLDEGDELPIIARYFDEFSGKSWLQLNDGTWLDASMWDKSLFDDVPTKNPEEYEAEVKAKATSPDVRDLIRNTEAYTGQLVTYSGTVLQVLEEHPWLSDRVIYTLRFAVDGDFDNVVTAKLIDEDENNPEWRPLEDDDLTLWGPVAGRAEYKTVLGQQIVLPMIAIEFVELH